MFNELYLALPAKCLNISFSRQRFVQRIKNREYFDVVYEALAGKTSFRLIM